MIGLAERTNVLIATTEWEGPEYTRTEEEEVPKPFLNEYLPTPTEIALACREIQKGWSEAERRRRRGFRRAHQQAPMLRVVRTAFAG
jgi:hypothetical protein